MDIETLKRELQIKTELANLAIYFLKRNGTKCCDKTNSMISCTGCNYNNLITGNIADVEQWIMDVKLKGK